MAMDPVKTETASVQTTTATTTLLWTAPTGEIAGRVIIIARESTSGSRADTGKFSRLFQRFVNFEASVVVDDSQLIDGGDDLTAGAGTWSIEIQDNGSGALEINVTGQASKDIEWTALIQHWDPTTA